MADAPKFVFGPFAAPSRGILVIFCDDGLNFGPATRKLLGAAADLVQRAAKTERFTGKSGAGLDQCSAEEFERLQDLNRRYNARFGFPFILAVRGYDRAGIIGEFARRVGNEPAAELQTCINQIHRIAQFRLDDLVSR